MPAASEVAATESAVDGRMRIALCHKRLDEKGGTERDFYLTATGLRDLGHEIHLFCSEFAIEPPSGTYLHRVPVLPFGRTARLWSFALRAPKMIANFKIDVIVSFGRMMSQDVLRSGGGPHKLFLEKLGEQGGMKRRFWQKVSIYHRSLLAFEKRQFAPGGYKKVIAVSAQVKRELMAAYAVPEEQIVVLYNGVDQKRFHPGLQEKWRGSMRREWGIPLEAPLVLFVGSGFRRKGLDRLLAAWASPTLENVFLFVVGDDARMGYYRAWAAQKAPGRIIFAGRQDNIERFYGAADVLALLSIQEAFGNVVLEALASGLSVLVSKNVGAAELLTGSLSEGLVDCPDDRDELESKLTQILKRCRDSAIAAEARRLGETHSWESHFKKLEACLWAVSRQGQGASLS